MPKPCWGELLAHPYHVLYVNIVKIQELRWGETKRYTWWNYKTSSLVSDKIALVWQTWSRQSSPLCTEKYKLCCWYCWHWVFGWGHKSPGPIDTLSDWAAALFRVTFFAHGATSFLYFRTFPLSFPTPLAAAVWAGGLFSSFLENIKNSQLQYYNKSVVKHTSIKCFCWVETERREGSRIPITSKSWMVRLSTRQWWMQRKEWAMYEFVNWKKFSLSLALQKLPMNLNSFAR